MGKLNVSVGLNKAGEVFISPYSAEDRNRAGQTLQIPVNSNTSTMNLSVPQTAEKKVDSITSNETVPGLATLGVNDIIANWKIEQKIGEGGFGAVYK
ncbi:hypothetical protein TELCIR_12889, partial [Teladorsagia circumcincta]